ncbi:CARDB domain-containing protein [Natribaculum luteum]|uniref:CARDB domain-containing protein n=1 Tax=Natribaculum luteum TaxID=1586232 RepID=A0ABD5P4T4_9EURY|nr:CARDB domain-containing protein [Natribaculum luteum]
MSPLKPTLVVALVLTLGLAAPTAAIPLEHDATGAVVLEPSSSSNGTYATLESGELEVDFERLNDDAVTTANAVFTITATDDVGAVWIDHEVAGVAFYRGSDPTATIDASSPLELSAGDTAAVGVAVDTHVATDASESFSVHVRYADDDEDDASSSLEVTDLEVSPTVLDPGDAVTVRATYANDDDDVTRTTIAELTVDGRVVDEQVVTVRPGETETVAFERPIVRTGSVRVGVGGVFRTVVVSHPDVAVTDVTLAADRIPPGESIVVTATFENEGNASLEATGELAVGGAVVDTHAFALSPGEATTVTFEWRPTEPGTYDVAVDGVDAGTVTVVESSVSVGNRELASATVVAVVPPAMVASLFLLGAVSRRLGR